MKRERKRKREISKYFFKGIFYPFVYMYGQSRCMYT